MFLKDLSNVSCHIHVSTTYTTEQTHEKRHHPHLMSMGVPQKIFFVIYF